MIIACDETFGTNLRLRLYGALDGTGARTLQTQLAVAARAPQGDVLLDLTGVDFIDDDGLGAVIFLSKQLSARRRRLRLVGINDNWLGRLRGLGLASLVDPASALPWGGAERRRRHGVVH